MVKEASKKKINKASKKNKGNPLIIITTGGTGGHVFPAEALAGELQKDKYRLVFITDERGENYKGILGKLQTYRVSAGGIAGKGILGKFKSVVRLAKGVWQATRLLKKLNPAMVVSFGGYASLPAASAATLLGVPLVLHEQNAVLGRTNRLLVPKAKVVATSFNETKAIPDGAHTEYTGMPIRKDMVKLASTPYPINDNGKFNLLVLGGSQGATVLSEVVPEAIKLLPENIRDNISIVQQCRPEDIEKVTAIYKGIKQDAELKVFFDNMAEKLKNAHLVISRSGASSVAEIAVAGKPAIYVPYMYAADDHQTANARAMDDAGAAWLIPQEEFTAESLSFRLSDLLSDNGVMERTAKCAKAVGCPDAAVKLANIVKNSI
jgi:UDP-N-acetylglucosamine--N-acetylmuramyl-(pentapeptide) pyrophosphoryl-undecaprenol N-acetylglucosamine transferase